MGSGRMGFWIIVNFHLEIKLLTFKNEKLPFKTNIPLFHV